MDSSRIIGIHQTRNQLGIQSINSNNLNESIGRLLYFQENQKREGAAVLVSPQHIITPIVNVVSPQSKEFSVKDSFVFQSSLGEYVGVKELFFEKTFQYDDWNEASIADQQYCCCAIMQLEKPIRNVRHCGIVSIQDYSDFFKVHTNKYLYLPSGKNESTYVIENFEQDKYFVSFDVNQQTHLNEQKTYQQFRINTQIPVFVNDIESLGGLCLVGFAQQYLQTSKFQTWILSKDNFEDIHKWLNGHNASFTVDYETTIDSSRNFKSKELKDSKNAQAHNGKVLCLFKLEKYYAASCSEDKQIKVWNWRTGKLKKIFKTDRPCKLVFGINEFLIGVEGNMMIVINWKNKRVENISTHTCEVNIVRPVKNRSDKIDRIILIDIQNCIYLYRFDQKVKGFQLERELLRWDIPNDVINNCLNYSESQIIFSTKISGNISIFNWVQGREERRYETKEINKGIQTVSQNQNGIVCMMIHPQKSNYILISCQSGAFGVWDTERATIEKKIAQLQNPIQTMDRQSFNQIVISDGKDYQLLQISQILNFQSKKYTSYHFNDINHVLHLDDEFFLTSDTSGRLRIWQLEQPYILPDGMIGTANHPVFNILQCPELSSLNNSISSSAIHESSKQYNTIQNKQTDYSSNQNYQQFNQQSIQSNNNNQIANSYSNQNQQNNYINDQTYEQEEANNHINDYETNQNQEQLSMKHLQAMENDQEQTFSNSKFVNDSQDNIQPEQQQKQDLILDIQQQKSKYDELEYADQTPQFNPSSFENLNNEKSQSGEKGQNKVKLLNLEEAFNIKRLELEKQQQQNNSGATLQPIYSLYSKIPTAQYQSNHLQAQDQEGKLTDIQNQIIQSDRSMASEFSLYKHNRNNSREEDHEILQPDLGEDDDEGRQLNQDDCEQETLCLNDNIQKDQQQNTLKVNDNDVHNYNSVVSNTSESYLAAIHSHLVQRPSLQAENIQQNVLKQHNESNQISNSQLSNMINVVNQKLIQINSDPQLQQSIKSNEAFKQAQQKGSPLISQEEAQQLRMELENLRLKINEYKKLNDSLDVNQQIITKKLNMEIEKSESEKLEKEKLITELNQIKGENDILKSNLLNLQLEKDQFTSVNSNKEEEIRQLRQINTNYEKEVLQYKQQKEILEEEIRVIQQNQKTDSMMRENIFNENQNLIKINQELNLNVTSLQSQIQNMTIQKHQENQKILEENSNLLKQISTMKIEKQNLISQNENLVNNNQQLINQCNNIAKEKAASTQEIEELKKQNTASRKEITFYQQENSKLQQQNEATQKELANLKHQFDNSKLNYSNERQNFIDKVNQIITEQANEKNLIQLTECIKNSQISVKELEQIQKNIYEKQIKNLYSQIDEQQRENQRILKQTSQIEIQNKNLIQDIENTRKENERLKSDLRRTKDSLEHWVKQYSVLLDREKLQIKNIESKEELILLLKQEIEKLNSLYQQQLQDQINHNATINGNSNNNIYEQCRKELLLDEWNSLLSLIENESMAQFSRIEQTNRKSEKIAVIPQANIIQTQQLKHQFQPVQQANYFSHQKDPRNSQNSNQIFIQKDYQIASQSDNKSNYQNPLSQITQNIPSQSKQNSQSQLSNSISPLYSKNLFQQSIDIKQPSTPNQIKSQINQFEQNLSQKQFQNNTSPNLQSSQITTSPQSSVKAQVSVTQQYNTNIKPKPQQSFNGSETPQTPSQPYLSAEKQIQKPENEISQQNNSAHEKKKFTNYYSYQNEAINQKLNSNQAITQNENQKQFNHSSQNNLQTKNFFSAQKSEKDTNTQGQYNNPSITQQYSSNHNTNNNNSNLIHYRSKSDISQSNQQEMINKSKEKVQVQNYIESQPQKEDISNEHRSKSPQSVNISNQIQQQQKKQQQQQQQQQQLQQQQQQYQQNIQNYQQKNVTYQNNYSNSNQNNLVQPEKSDRSISGLQNLKNMKKNISLTNVSSQPISTLNIATISPSSYNDRPSEFIRRQIEHQQYVQYIDTKNYDSLRSLTPQPAKSNFVFQSNNINQEKQIVTDQTTQNTQNEEILPRRDTFDPQAFKKEKLEVQTDYPKTYSSQSPLGRLATTPVTGNSNIGSMIYPSYLGDTRKQISFTPTPSVKKQKIQEALKMTYLNNKDEQTQYNIQKLSNQGAVSQN
ncbi:hypothetical protein TTHERM_00411470 (macronuclear) [Tetrahymena thermophila SB210]|uniref:WD domain, G-beta repeat protein n=1 Tax=Tetrahymena thermophila (strain SB210) TaxID=312017 RepID=I7MKY1_TETTS|nr:hypothetical protein TTHERM_00411470 [Tetrahymena thermophila SB210]EAS00596.2 hypothetical protein TTHERM_00411470 [Tetrahymena thermophila SB210]|eukprot:XP_001020841.2 hypothetical protein TTHERM_00411470 [Tetrahymena thermophila SB210]